MKKAFLVLFGLLGASQAFAQTAVCGGAATGTYTPAASMFVVRSFPVKCSANTVVTARENAVAFAVGALSTKGKSFFQGNTGGGAISAQPCTGAVCTSGMEDVGLQAALNAAT